MVVEETTLFPVGGVPVALTLLVRVLYAVPSIEATRSIVVKLPDDHEPTFDQVIVFPLTVPLLLSET